MTKTFSLTVRTPEATILDQEATSVKLTTEGGELEMYPGHASTTGSILFGNLAVRTEQGENQYILQRGVVFTSVETNSVQILCYKCQEMKDIEYKSAQEYLQYIEDRLNKGDELNDFQMNYLENEKIAMVQQIKTLEKAQ